MLEEDDSTSNAHSCITEWLHDPAPRNVEIYRNRTEEDISKIPIDCNDREAEKRYTYSQQHVDNWFPSRR